MSMKPGATTLPVASISRSASGTSPTRTMRSPAMPTSAGRGAAPGAVDDEAVPDRELDAHREPLSIPRRVVVDAPVGDHDAVALPRRGDGHLLVEDVLEHGRRVALERVAEPAAAGRDVA